MRVTLIEPGMVDTPFFDDEQPQALTADDIARSVIYALSQPETVDVHEIMALRIPANIGKIQSSIVTLSPTPDLQK